ncbi:hypothetical protein [Flavobacterium sp. SOK18b]|uniref:hypothetical protein n=1 Tax=Flavobacterium sp. SOK18b TaxID=797900 RepID=UPI0015FCB50A|nr:hypothetical protein [Flavobacterium sp. SOK18b]
MRLRIMTNYEDLLKDTLINYNFIYKTDFVFVEYIYDEVNFAIIEFTNADLNQVFDLGRIFGGMSEAFDKRISNPPSSFM